MFIPQATYSWKENEEKRGQRKLNQTNFNNKRFKDFKPTTIKMYKLEEAGRTM